MGLLFELVCKCVLQVYNVDLRQAAWFSAVPWCMMALVGYFGGACSDTLIQRGLSITLTRKIMQVGYFSPFTVCFIMRNYLYTLDVHNVRNILCLFILSMIVDSPFIV